MNVFLAQDRQNYRRWINVIVALLLPGASHFLTGRKVAAVGWFLTALLWRVVLIGLLVWPSNSYTPQHPGFCGGFDLALQFIIAADSCRRPLARLSFKRWALFVAVFLAVLPGPGFLLLRFVVRPFVVPTAAMQPTLAAVTHTADGPTGEADHIFVNRLAYWFSKPERGDIVVFSTTGINDPRVPPHRYYVKRVVGLPGERVQLAPPSALINGQRLETPSIFARIAQQRDGYTGYVATERLAFEIDEIALEADEYLVLGDNSRNSLDGRHFGPIPRRLILGKVFYRYAPASRKGWVE